MGTSKYKLEQLGWFNFEQLIRRLLRELIGAGLSTFSGSRDQGRDASFIGKANDIPSGKDPWDGNWIFQVKHRTYSSRGASVVRSEMKSSLAAEIDKIINKHEFECHNYVYITNCPLTASDKDEMTAVIRVKFPVIPNVLVVGESDVDELLDGHPQVVSMFPQILGLSQLKEMVHWSLHQRSFEYLQSAQAEIALFVATTPYQQAFDLLHKQHFCILSGPPKMGKTCTAYALAAAFSTLSFEVYDLRTQDDFYKAYNKDTKQLFLCDDVFGDISLHAAKRDDWSRGFTRLLNSLDHSHKLVWTAREYILKEALSSSKLKEERPTLATTDKVKVAVDQLSRLEKAMILYNHAKAANLPLSIREYLKGPACLSIIDHDNYSPESIRQLCTGRLVSFSREVSGEVSRIALMVSEFLSKPGDAWKNAFSSAPDGEKLLCIEVMAAGGRIAMPHLKDRYENSTLGTREGSYPAFDASLANATGTFLRVKPAYNDRLDVEFYHPSMRDLLSELIERDKSMRFRYLKQLVLEEVTSVARPHGGSPGDGSSQHMILIEDDDDLALLKDHLTDNLLPRSKLLVVYPVLGDLLSTLREKKGGVRGGSRRRSADVSKTVWVILDATLAQVCSKDFWRDNSDSSFSFAWRYLFEYLRRLLPYGTDPLIPTYIPEMLRRYKDDASVNYWRLVKAAHAISPTIVEQCVDFDDRDQCRQSLADRIAEALASSEDLDLEDDPDDSERWYDDYGSLPEECADYNRLFPDDGGVEGADDLAHVQEEYPKLEREPDMDYDPDDFDRDEPSSDSDSDVMAIFSDL